MYENEEEKLKGKVDELRFESAQVDEDRALCHREARHQHTENSLTRSSCKSELKYV